MPKVKSLRICCLFWTILKELKPDKGTEAQIKVETEGEEKVNNSYLSIYKQFTKIPGSLGIVPLGTVGKPFDPMMLEAIMHEESTEFEAGIILEEFLKVFKLRDHQWLSYQPDPAEAQEELKALEEQSGEAGIASETSEEGGKDRVCCLRDGIT